MNEEDENCFVKTSQKKCVDIMRGAGMMGIFVQCTPVLWRVGEVLEKKQVLFLHYSNSHWYWKISKYLNIFIHTRNTNNVQCHSWRSYDILCQLFVLAKWSLKPDVDVEAWSWPGGGMEVWPYFCPVPAQLQCCTSGTILLITASIIAMQHCEDTQRHSLARKLDRE